LMACYQTNVLPGTLSCQFQPFLVGFVCFQLSALVCISGLRNQCFSIIIWFTGRVCARPTLFNGLLSNKSFVWH
jgi:hypothetical protein